MAMTGVLEGQVALVTGGARGIGRAIARKLAGAGADVVVNYYNSHAEAEALCAELRTHRAAVPSPCREASAFRRASTRCSMRCARTSTGSTSSSATLPRAC
jgi:NAD(P)-dependent dehydrogenase (short-subunit alcohol dehydrogenase family)